MADIANTMSGIEASLMGSVQEEAQALQTKRMKRQAVVKRLSAGVFRLLSQPESLLPLGYHAGPGKLSSLFKGF